MFKTCFKDEKQIMKVINSTNYVNRKNMFQPGLIYNNQETEFNT